MNESLWNVLAYFVAVMVLVGGILGLSAVLGQRHHDHATGEPYESGILPTGSARGRFSSRFYLIAMFFVIFDLEAVFVFAWAIAFREAGWTGYAEILVFIGVLLAGLVYLWRTDGLDSKSTANRSTQTREE